ncbi:hypothetical protein FGB90_11595 [Alteribacter natronophilus]|nr:hypothetical protein FGB90_11595 [Alteribacter natronophilus]
MTRIRTKSCQAVEIFADSCGRKSAGETPQGEARGGSAASRGKWRIFQERLSAAHFDCSDFLLSPHFCPSPITRGGPVTTHGQKTRKAVPDGAFRVKINSFFSAAP